jgi:hypothetical protein
MAKTTARITVNKVASKAVSKEDSRVVNKEDSRAVSKEDKAVREAKVALAASVVDADADVDASAVAASPPATSLLERFTKTRRRMEQTTRLGV